MRYLTFILIPVLLSINSFLYAGTGPGIGKVWLFDAVNYEKTASALLNEKFPDEEAAVQSSFITEDYFDTREFVLNSSGIQLLIRIDRKAQPVNRKGKPDITKQILLGPVAGSVDLSELIVINPDGAAVFTYKNYNKTASIYEKHELLRYIKRSERPVFLDLVRRLGVNEPLLLKRELNFSGNRRVLSLKNAAGESFADIILDDGEINSNGWKNPAYIISLASTGSLNDKQQKTVNYITDKLEKSGYSERFDQRLNFRLYFNNYISNNSLIMLSIKYPFITKIISLLGILIFSAAVFFTAKFFLKKE